MIYVFFAFRLTLAVVMLLAASGKALQPEQFVAALRLSHIPSVLVIPLAVLVPIIELGLSIGLVLSPPTLLPALLATTLGLLFTFTVWMISVHVRQLHVKCGCFGTASDAVDLRSITRNILLLILAFGALVISLKIHSSLLTPSLWLVIIVLSLALCLIHLLAFQRGRASLILSKAEFLRLRKQAV